MAVFSKSIYPENNPVYSGNAEYDNPKESFKEVTRIIQSRFGNASISLVDVGCASGAFLFYATKQLRVARSAGVDISDTHLEQAKRYMPDTGFFVDSILSLDSLAGQTFDVCTCLGTLAIFDDLDVPLKNLLSLVRVGGRMYVHDLFNDDPVDVIMRYRLASASDDSDWLAGFNVRSKVTYEKLIRRYAPTAEIHWHNFSMPFPISRRDDPLRAWTIRTEEREHQIVVGTGQMLNFKILEVHKLA